MPSHQGAPQAPSLSRNLIQESRRLSISCLFWFCLFWFLSPKHAPTLNPQPHSTYFDVWFRCTSVSHVWRAKCFLHPGFMPLLLWLCHLHEALCHELFREGSRTVPLCPVWSRFPKSAVLKLLGFRTPLHSSKLLTIPKSFYLGGFYLSIFIVLVIKTEILKRSMYDF